MVRLALSAALTAASAATGMRSVTAQDVVVPPTCTATDGTGGGAIPGFNERFRLQTLLDARDLTQLTSRSISGLSFRRDGQDLRAMTGGQCSMVIRLSTAPSAPGGIQPFFAANHGSNALEVFNGAVTIPSSPALSHRDAAGWLPQHSVHVTFDRPFAYVGGPLCIDIEAAPVVGATSPWWRADYDISLHDGSAVAISAPCDPRANAFVAANTLVPAGAIRLTGTGPTDSVAMTMLGVTRLSAPVDLTFLGAPGCTLDITPMLTLGSTHSHLAAHGYGVAALEIPLPGTPQIAGAALFAQWASTPGSGNRPLTTSEAIELRIATLPLPARNTMVRTGPLAPTQPIPASGRVYPHMAPVICLRAQ
jgi:hypothetical protein